MCFIDVYLYLSESYFKYIFLQNTLVHDSNIQHPALFDTSLPFLHIKGVFQIFCSKNGLKHRPMKAMLSTWHSACGQLCDPCTDSQNVLNAKTMLVTVNYNSQMRPKKVIYKVLRLIILKLLVEIPHCHVSKKSNRSQLLFLSHNLIRRRSLQNNINPTNILKCFAFHLFLGRQGKGHTQRFVKKVIAVRKTGSQNTHEIT